MTDTHESGRHVTPERIRKGAEAMQAQGFGLQYECPLGASDKERRFYQSYWRMSKDLYRRYPPCEQGRMA